MWVLYDNIACNAECQGNLALESCLLPGKFLQLSCKGQTALSPLSWHCCAAFPYPTEPKPSALHEPLWSYAATNASQYVLYTPEQHPSIWPHFPLIHTAWAGTNSSWYITTQCPIIGSSSNVVLIYSFGLNECLGSFQWPHRTLTLSLEDKKYSYF